MARDLHLSLNALYDGTHAAAWRAPGAAPLRSLDPGHWAHLVRTAERGTLDAVFLADALGFLGPPDAGPAQAFDPTVLLAALAVQTSRVGLIGTASTTFEEPYNVARRFASLDLLSGGRAAWNAVTTVMPSVAAQFSARPHLERHVRYARAEEFISVVCDLWDSWEDGALLGDAAQGRYADPDRIHVIAHRGEHFAVDGPLVSPRSLQGRPVLLQAGASPGGLALAGRYAEAIFTASATIEHAAALREEVVRYSLGAGRAADAVRILPGLVFTLGSTEAEARRRYDALEALVDGDPREGLAAQIGADPDDLRWDEPLPESLLGDPPAHVVSVGARDIVLDLARRERLTVRQLLDRISGWHRQFIGTPERLADDIEAWFSSGAVDGFNLMPDVLPDGLDDFVDHVVPLLRKRGIFRHEYVGSTLREHLNLPRPESRYSPRRPGAATIS